MQIPIDGPGDGFFGEAILDRRMINQTGGARSVGDVSQIDESVIDSGTLAQTTMEAITALGAEMGTIGVWLQDTAVGDTGLVRFIGDVPAQTGSTPAAGAFLGVTAAATTLTATGATDKVVGKALETGTSSPTMVRFNGVHGFGNDNA